jgi:hypothetical protein
MTNRQQQIIIWLMALNAIAFLFIFMWVASNYRLAADDYHHLSTIREHGIWGSMIYYYQNWNPRWSSILVTNTFLSFENLRVSLLAFFVSTIAIGTTAMYSMLSAINRLFQLPFSKVQIAVLAVYLLATTFYISFSKDDSWFWITVAPMYLWGTLLAILGASLLLHQWGGLVRRAVVFLLFIYVGGSSESAAIVSLITFLFVGFKYRNKTTPWLDKTALHLAILGCLIGFGILLSGPGIEIRREHLPHHPLFDRVAVGLMNYIKFDLIEIPLRIPLLIFFVAPFGFFGRKQLRLQLVSWKEIFWTNRTIWIFSDIIILILAMSLGVVMSEMGPTRTWLPLTPLVLVVGVITAYQMGTWVYIHSKGKLFLLVVTTQIVVLGFQVYSGVDQINTTSNYTEKVDDRMEEIESKGNEKLVHLSSLPESGWLFSAELSSDSLHHTNKHLSMFYNNKHVFVVEDDLSSD